MSDIKFQELQKYKVKNGPQKYNFFIESKEMQNNLKFQVEQITTVSRPIELSLRTVVKNNRQKLPEAITSEEKALQLLATGR